MNNRRLTDKQKSRTALTMLVSCVVFVILLISLALIFVIAYVLFRTGVLSEVSEGYNNTRLVIFLLVMISLVVGAGITLVFTFVMTKPMKRIMNAIDELASGNFQTRLELDEPLASMSDIKEFTEAFNKMASELDRTEILRTDFINNFSHEFKTPIVSIAGFAKLLRRGGLTDEQKEEYTAIIEEESLRLSDMATNVLNLTKTENQSIITNQTEYNLSEQIRGCVLLLENKWNAKKLVPDLRFDEHNIYANEEMLKQVWINLIDNAIKFTDTGGEIIIDIAENADSLTVTVSNTGSEIPVEDRDRIFNKFYQGDRSHSTEGSGVGLAIVRNIVKLHSGTVSLSSEGGMTTFSVTLPAAKP